MRIVKQSDETRANTTALADDSELTASLDGSAAYMIEGCIEARGSVTGQLKAGLSYTGTINTATGFFTLGDAVSTLTAASESGNQFRIAPTNVDSTPSSMGAAGSSTVSFRNGGYFKFVIQTTSSGTFAVQWAQNVSNATASTVYAGSWLEVIDLRPELLN